MNDQDSRSRVVILGGGFAGLFAARALRRAQARITLIDSRQHHLFQPLLYQCATGILSEGKIAAPLREVLRRHRNVNCVMAEATGIDTERRRVQALRPGGEQIEFGYDYLIVAAGVQQSYFGHDEFARYAPGMKTIADALLIRRRVFGAFEMAETATDDPERTRWLTFALVGAGPTGVELAGQIREVGLYAGNRIRHEIAGRASGKPFRYHDLGSAAYISRGRAVVSVGRLHFGGFPGWLVWLFIHIGFLTGYRSRLGAVLSWWLAFTRDMRRERTFTTREVGVVRDVYSGEPN